MSEPILTIEHLTIRYQGQPRPAVEDLNFHLNQGEILSLHGPSGAGKSTVVWALMGMLETYRAVGTGTITFLGERVDLAAAPRGLRRSWEEIALVPQSSMSALNPIRTVGESLLEMMAAHEGKGDRRQRLERAAAGLQSAEKDPQPQRLEDLRAALAALREKEASLCQP